MITGEFKKCIPQLHVKFCRVLGYGRLILPLFSYFYRKFYGNSIATIIVIIIQAIS